MVLPLDFTLLLRTAKCLRLPVRHPPRIASFLLRATLACLSLLRLRHPLQLVYRLAESGLRLRPTLVLCLIDLTDPSGQARTRRTEGPRSRLLLQQPSSERRPSPLPSSSRPGRARACSVRCLARRRTSRPALRLSLPLRPSLRLQSGRLRPTGRLPSRLGLLTPPSRPSRAPAAQRSSCRPRLSSRSTRPRLLLYQRLPSLGQFDQRVRIKETLRLTRTRLGSAAGATLHPSRTPFNRQSLSLFPLLLIVLATALRPRPLSPLHRRSPLPSISGILPLSSARAVSNLRPHPSPTSPIALLPP